MVAAPPRSLSLPNLIQAIYFPKAIISQAVTAFKPYVLASEDTPTTANIASKT
ncbi:hypothetical protein PL10110_870021 [Planktothrix agardhii]|nr:hypothetical protein PL10110_870021 [Planktothrix agardhii]